LKKKLSKEEQLSSKEDQETPSETPLQVVGKEHARGCEELAVLRKEKEPAAPKQTQSTGLELRKPKRKTGRVKNTTEDMPSFLIRNMYKRIYLRNLYQVNG